jgi:hypothetical protein
VIPLHTDNPEEFQAYQSVCQWYQLDLKIFRTIKENNQKRTIKREIPKRSGGPQANIPSFFHIN